MTRVSDYQNEYDRSRSALALAAETKFQGMIAQGKARALEFFQRLGTEAPMDYIVPTDKMDFLSRDNRLMVQVESNGFSGEWYLHRNAVNQMVGKTGILSTRVSDKMFEARSAEKRDTGVVVVDPWGQELLLHNLRTIYEKSDRARVLLRVVRTQNQIDRGVPGEIRGFLSDRYGRWSSGPILSAFAAKAAEFGAVPLVSDSRYQSIFQTDVRLGFSMFLPVVFEPVDGEVLLLGMTVRTSDFGAGAFAVSLMMMRIKCTNMQIMRQELKKVHLGGRLGDDIQFSTETYEADTRAMALATRDTVETLLSPERINRQVEVIRRAATENIDATKLHDGLRRKGHILKGEEQRINELFRSADVEMLPPGNTLWRSAQSVALFANELEGEGEVTRATQLRAVSGMMVDRFEDKLAKEANKSPIEA